jgi:hypothetical protein
MKSTSSYLLYVHLPIVEWKSKLQTIAPQSTVGAELIASAIALRAVNWISGCLSEVGNDNGNRGSMLLFTDTQYCVTMLIPGNRKSDERHLRIRDYLINEALPLGTDAVEHIAEMRCWRMPRRNFWTAPRTVNSSAV